MAVWRFGLYFAWSRRKEIGALLGKLDDRFPGLFEFRRILWPRFENLADKEDAGIAGFLDHVIFADFKEFRRVIKDVTGHDVPVIQREGGAPSGQLDDDLLKGINTLIVVSLDHVITGQRAEPGEIELIRSFIAKPQNTLVVCPHHFIGELSDLHKQEVEHAHHSDPTIPGRQKFSGFACSLLEGLGFSIENKYGLNPAQAADGSPAPLVLYQNLDHWDVLKGVSTFNRHPHLPHLFVPPRSSALIEVLAQQPINLHASGHPFVEAGKRVFNALLQVRREAVGGRLFFCDATMWSSAFGGLDSLKAFWSNLAKLPT